VSFILWIIYSGKINGIINKFYNPPINTEKCKIKNLTCNSSYSNFFIGDLKDNIDSLNVVIYGECETTNKVVLKLYNNPNISIPFNLSETNGFYYGLPNICGMGLQLIDDSYNYSYLIMRILLYTNTLMFNQSSFIQEEGSIQSYINKKYINTTYNNCYSSFAFCQGYDVIYYYKFK
jgi:hypothetical protein